eukprot:Nitzschia sp. Nitz4//scaffold200_size39268//23272//24306//NITZ4_007619-RA/size39268-processed-gene-0.63-mRNA-1//-1//CDS//3329541295//3787//frame0
MLLTKFLRSPLPVKKSLTRCYKSIVVDSYKAGSASNSSNATAGGGINGASQKQQREQQQRMNDLVLQAAHEEHEQQFYIRNSSIGIPFDPPQKKSQGECPFRYVPLQLGAGQGHRPAVLPTPESKAIIESEVSLEDITKMTNAFYLMAHQDETLDKFLRSRDDPHGERFAKWVHQKMTGSNVWDLDCQHRREEQAKQPEKDEYFVHDRSSAHKAAWNSPKRPAQDQGQTFTLADCRVWMRIHFWAMREAGLVQKSPTFVDYYVRLIGHFVAIYEKVAPPFTRESFRWSEDSANIEAYIQNGRRMTDVLSENFGDAWDKLPEGERKDMRYWPYLLAEEQELMDLE